MKPLPYYGQFASKDLIHIEQLKAALASDSREFFEPAQAQIPARTFDNIAEILAVSAPGVPLQRLALSARFCIWMYLLDYYFDEQPPGAPGSRNEIQQLVNETLHGIGNPRFFLDQSLRDLLAALKSDAASSPLLSAFTAQIQREVEAARRLFDMAEAARQTGTLPTAAAFIDEAANAVNHMSCSMSLLLALGEPMSQSAIDVLRPPLLHAAISIRLANDLRTHAKDDAEGLLHMLRFWDRNRVLREIDNNLACCKHEAQALLAAGAPASAHALVAITEIGIQMYGLGDIRSET